MHANRRTNVKMLAAVIGGSAVVAAGAVTMAITQEQASSANVEQLGHDGRRNQHPGNTAHRPETTLAAPAVKATPFGGAGS